VSEAWWAVEAANMQGEQQNPVVAIVIGVVGIVLLAVGVIRDRRKRRGRQEPPLHSFLDK
jgi:hypothetical protein